MKGISFRILIVVAAVMMLLVGSSAVAFADDAPFLCPVVGGGVLNADDKNGDNRVEAIEPPVGTSLLPGNNQAGANANPKAYNTEGPGNANAGPGHNPDFSPIWPH